MQLTVTILSIGNSSIILFGHVETHFLHDTHFSSSIFTIPFSVTVIAFTGQTLTQSPYPKQPYLQDLSPPSYKFIAAQVVTSPSNSYVLLVFVQSP